MALVFYSHILSYGITPDDNDAVIKLFHRHTGRVAFVTRLSQVSKIDSCLNGLYGSIAIDSASDKIVIPMAKHICTWSFRTDDWMAMGTSLPGLTNFGELDAEWSSFGIILGNRKSDAKVLVHKNMALVQGNQILFLCLRYRFYGYY